MICPKCGEEIKDGYMYCPKCGEEVIMVPDYEIELEEGIEQTISQVAEMMADSVENMNSLEETIQAEEKKAGMDSEVYKPEDKAADSFIDKVKKTGSGILITTAVILGLLFVYGVFRLVSYVNDYYSYDSQIEKAHLEFDAKDYDSAIKTLKHVISLDQKNEEPRLMLADSYFNLGKYDESIAVLTELLNIFPTDNNIYERLIANYEAEGDTDSVLKLYEKNPDADASGMFEGYSSMEPQFNLDGGTYVEAQNISITSPDEGTIYYTLDGTEPTKSSNVYDKPIALPLGQTTVTAINVNNKGVVSNPVSMTYFIELPPPIVPQILTEPGDYTVPQLIKLELPEEGTLYYTTDGTDPDSDSKKYEPPVPMPLGKSEFRFVIINDKGIKSDIVTAKYDLNISGSIDRTYAQNAVQLKLITLGHPVMAHEFIASYGYSHEGRNYYIVEEYSSDTGKRLRQSTVYAVDSQTGEVFTIKRNTSKEDYDFGVVN